MTSVLGFKIIGDCNIIIVSHCSTLRIFIAYNTEDTEDTSVQLSHHHS